MAYSFGVSGWVLGWMGGWLVGWLVDWLVIRGMVVNLPFAYLDVVRVAWYEYYINVSWYVVLHLFSRFQ